MVGNIGKTPFTSYSSICTTSESEFDLVKVQIIMNGGLQINLGLIFNLGSVKSLQYLTEPKLKINSPNLP